MSGRCWVQRVGRALVNSGDKGVRLSARSVSGQVREWLGQGPSAGRVLSVHKRVCNTVADCGAVIALVAPEIGDGPLNVVLGDWPGNLSGLLAGMPVAYDSHRLELYSTAIDLAAARTWEPCPHWGELRKRSTEIGAGLKRLAALCWEHTPDNPLWSALGAPPPGNGRTVLLAARLGEAAQRLKAGWDGDARALAEGGAALAGLGDGLTPAGDDFLMGAMLWAWLAHPAPERFCRTLAEAAAPQTTTLSAAFLRAAARGQCSAAWQSLLAALAGDEPAPIAGAARKVLAYGASSGLDALIGFLYMSRAPNVVGAP